MRPSSVMSRSSASRRRLSSLTDAQAAVGLVRRLLDLAVRRDAVEAHAADADVEIVVAVEGHAERLAADMGEDLHRLVVGREESGSCRRGASRRRGCRSGRG